MNERLLVMGLVMAGLRIMPVYADNPAPHPTLVNKDKKTEAPLPDEEILSRLHLTNQDEIHAGELAEEHALADSVRQFGVRLQKDHKDADIKVRALAGRLGIKLREEPTPQSNADQAIVESHDRHMGQLENLNGAAFDKKFIALMARSHQSSVQALEHQRVLLPKDSPVQDLLSQLLPTLRDHYQIASTLGGLPN